MKLNMHMISFESTNIHATFMHVMEATTTPFPNQVAIHNFFVTNFVIAVYFRLARVVLFILNK